MDLDMYLKHGMRRYMIDWWDKMEYKGIDDVIASNINEIIVMMRETSYWEWATHLNMIVLWFRVIPSRNRLMKNWMESIPVIWRAYNVSFHTWESCVLHRLWWDIIIFAESCLKWMMTCALIFVLANCVIIVLPQVDIMTLKPIWTTIRLVAVSTLIRVTLE